MIRFGGVLRLAEFSCQAPKSKIFLFPRIPISIIYRPVPHPSGGALRIVTKRWARDAMAAGGVGWVIHQAKRLAGGRRSRVVLAPRPWRQSAPPVRAP